MLAELHVSQLGVIEEAIVTLEPGMTALTGETGAGKTLLVEAIELLLGARADPLLVRPGAAEALVEGRFLGEGPGEELVAGRAVPASGRSRAYLDGRLAGGAALAEAVGRLVDLHGQHAYQSLLSPAAQRQALDAAGGTSLARLEAARRRLREVEASLAALGGDERARARELDLLRWQLEELDGARLSDPGEDELLQEEEERLAAAATLRDAAGAAQRALAGEGGALDRAGEALASLGHHRAFEELRVRLAGVCAELSDAASEARALGEKLEDDPDRLAEIEARRALLRDLRRKYGETLAEVIAYREQARNRLAELAAHEERAAALEKDRRAAEAELAAAEEEVGAARRRAAPSFARAVEERLRQLAMPSARFSVEVGGRAGAEVAWLLAANPGEPLQPLARVASGGELARTMLAARLVMSLEGSGDGRVLVFDEVDAGVGGEAALSVGRALASLARRHQVLVVTHLPQVAAFADNQLAVRKREVGGRAAAEVSPLSGPERVVELSRMMSGRPESNTARRHAEELLEAASAERMRAERTPAR